jgi:hypothetical protein
MTFPVTIHPANGQFEAALGGAPQRGLSGLFGKYRDDPTLRDICDAAYQERDADVREGKRSTPGARR